MVAHQVPADPVSCSSTTFVHPAGGILASDKICSEFSKNRTGSSAYVPDNCGNEALAARRSSYGISTELSEA